MQRLEQIPPEEMPRVVKIASEMYEADREREVTAHEQRAAVAAAKEVGLPDEYLERAAEEWQRRQELAQTTPHRRSLGTAALLLAMLGLIGFWLTMRLLVTPPIAPPAVAMPVPPIAVAAPPAVSWTVDDFNDPTVTPWNVAQESQGAVRFTTQSEAGHGQVGVIHVTKAGAKPVAIEKSTEWANPIHVTHLRFSVRGSTGGTVRAILESSPTERWVSPAVNMTERWETQSLELNGMEHQTRPDAQSAWKRTDAAPLEDLKRMQIQVENAKPGEVLLDDINLSSPSG